VKRKIITIIFTMVLAIAMLIFPAATVTAATVNASYFTSAGTITPGGAYTVAEAVSTPDDGKFVQLAESANVILKFPGNWYAVRSMSGSPDLQINIYDAVAPASAEILVSGDNINWVSLGIFSDDADINIDLDSYTNVPPAKYVKVNQNPSAPYDPGYPGLRFDLDGVVALNANELWSITVGARDNPNAPPFNQLNVPISWAKTFASNPPPNASGVWNTTFTQYISQTGPSATFILTAPLTYTAASSSYVFRQWRIGTPTTPPSPLPAQPLNQATISITPTSDVMGLAVYQKIDFGQILTEDSNINPVGINHKVWVDLTALPGPEPVLPTLAGIPVTFVIDGVNAGSVVKTTDDSGKATFEYTGNNAGRDLIGAFIDSNKNGTLDSGELQASTVFNKWWVENFVTGGGNIKVGKQVAWTFSGMVGVDPSGGAIGNFQITDHVSKETYNLNQFGVLTFFRMPEGASSPEASNNTARFRGIGTRTSDGKTVEFVIMIQDNAEPGKDADKIAAELIRVGGELQVNGLIGSVNVPEDASTVLTWMTISGGNFQMHNLPSP
jgi:hypothetical protein